MTTQTIGSGKDKRTTGRSNIFYHPKKCLGKDKRPKYGTKQDNDLLKPVSEMG